MSEREIMLQSLIAEQQKEMQEEIKQERDASWLNALRRYSEGSHLTLSEMALTLLLI